MGNENGKKYSISRIIRNRLVLVLVLENEIEQSRNLKTLDVLFE